MVLKRPEELFIWDFFMNLIAVICYNVTMFLPAPAYFTGDSAFHTVLGSTLRLLVASFCSLSDWVTDKCKTDGLLKRKNMKINCFSDAFHLHLLVREWMHLYLLQ